MSEPRSSNVTDIQRYILYKKEKKENPCQVVRIITHFAEAVFD